jgi:hypothetical protein
VGLHRYRGVPLFVSRGIGYRGLPLRLHCPAEVALLTLRATPAKARRVMGLSDRQLINYSLHAACGKMV